MLWLVLIAGLAAHPTDPQQLASIDEAGVVRRSFDGGLRWTEIGRCELEDAELEAELEPPSCPANTGSLVFVGDAVVAACPDGELIVAGDVAPMAIALDAGERVTAIARDGDVLLVATSAGTLHRGHDLVPLPEPTRALATRAGIVLAAGDAHLWEWSAGGWIPLASLEACAISDGPTGVIAAGPAGVLLFDEWRARVIDPRPHVAVATSGATAWLSDGTAPRRTTARPRERVLPLRAPAPIIDRGDLARRARRARWVPRLDLVVRAGHTRLDQPDPFFRRARTDAFAVFATLTWNLDGVLDADILHLAGLTP